MKRKVEKIEIDKIRIGENSRGIIDEDDLGSLMNSIDGQGLMSPIEVTGNSTSGYLLIYGRRRLEACKKLGWITIEAFVKDDVSPSDYLIRNLTENIHRKDISITEKGRIFYMLYKNHNMTFSEISAKMHVKESAVRSAVKIHNQNIPEEYRLKITTITHGNKKRGMISSLAALKIGRMRREFQLNQGQIRDLFRYVHKKELTILKIQVISGLIRGGMSIDEAVKKSDDFVTMRIDVPINAKELEKEMKYLGVKTKQNFCAKLLHDGFRGNKKLVPADSFGENVILK